MSSIELHAIEYYVFQGFPLNSILFSLKSLHNRDFNWILYITILCYYIGDFIYREVHWILGYISETSIYFYVYKGDYIDIYMELDHHAMALNPCK